MLSKLITRFKVWSFYREFANPVNNEMLLVLDTFCEKFGNKVLTEIDNKVFSDLTLAMRNKNLYEAHESLRECAKALRDTYKVGDIFTSNNLTTSSLYDIVCLDKPTMAEPHKLVNLCITQIKEISKLANEAKIKFASDNKEADISNNNRNLLPLIRLIDVILTITLLTEGETNNEIRRLIPRVE